MWLLGYAYHLNRLGTLAKLVVPDDLQEQFLRACQTAKKFDTDEQPEPLELFEMEETVEFLMSLE